MRRLFAAGLMLAVALTACRVDTTPTVAPLVTESATPAVAAVRTEEAACRLVDRALSLPAYSSRWDSVLIDAQYAAVSDKFYTEIERASMLLFDAPMSDYEAKAQVILQNAFDRFC